MVRTVGLGSVVFLVLWDLSLGRGFVGDWGVESVLVSAFMVFLSARSRATCTSDPVRRPMRQERATWACLTGACGPGIGLPIGHGTSRLSDASRSAS